MAEYIAKFLSKGIRLLIKGQGVKFLNEYYNTIDKIYNLRIPLKDIASKGKIKKSLKEYEDDVKVVTKAGRPKSRQAWYELAIANNLDVSNGDTIYYINTGKSKSHSDVKKITHYYIVNNMGEKYEFTKEIDKGYKKYKTECSGKPLSKQDWIATAYPGYFKEDEITMNCILLPQEVMNREVDTFCSDISDDMEYNVPKYLEQFNKRITPLLVCFSKDIRSKILITNPKERPFFTEEECRLTSGEPNKPSDQDTYEQLMTMEDKEYKFWINNNLVPPFFEECGMGVWEEKKQEYLDRMEEERRLGIDKEREAYMQCLNELEDDEINNIVEDGELPESLLKLVDIHPTTGAFMSKNYPDMKIGSIDDILDILEMKEKGIMIEEE